MAWTFLFTYPLEANLFEWRYSSSSITYEPGSWTNSHHFLIKLIDYEIDEGLANTESPGYQPRSYFRNYCQLAEWGLSNINNSIVSHIGTTKQFKPYLGLIAQDIQLYLPYTEKIGDIYEGRIIALRRLAKRFRPNRYINYLTDDKMAFDVYHWI